MINTISIILIFLMFLYCHNAIGEEYYTIDLTPTCKYSYINENKNTINTFGCYVQPVETIPNIIGESQLYTEEIDSNPLSSKVNIHKYDSDKVRKSLVKSASISNEKYDNVAEPSFASNGSLILFTGNHYAARSINGSSWEYLDPYFDFKGLRGISGNMTNATTSTETDIIDLFWADQHVEYDPNNKIYVWIRQGIPISLGGTTNNVDRIGISKDTINWTVYDLPATRILNEASILKAIFDYPEIVLSNNFLYVTTSVLDAFLGKEYGMILRCPLNDLNLELDVPTNPPRNIQCNIILDRDVKAITPVDGATDPMYFGTHLPDSTEDITPIEGAKHPLGFGGAHLSDSTVKMKIYTWYERSNTIDKTVINVTDWNNINNREICSIDSETWWCKANTSSKIRSAWLFNNTINFFWNAIGTYNGKTWKPYVESATFDPAKNMKYERKYPITDSSKQWVFGAATSNNNKIGTTAFYATDNYNPYLNLAFGIFNFTNNKWDMMPILNSSSSLPVLNEEGNNDYNWGDFLTIRKHEKTSKEDPFSWELGGYKLTGRNYHDVEPYMILIK